MGAFSLIVVINLLNRTMEKSLALYFILVTAVSASPLLMWSSRDFRSAYKLPLGSHLNDEDFNNVILAPLCNEAQFVVFDVDNLSYKTLTEVADEASTGWSFLKNALMEAKLEKLVEYSGSGDTPALCGAQYIPIKGKEKPIDEQLSDALPTLSGDKPVVYIIRSVNNVGESSEQTKRVNRRDVSTASAAVPNDDTYGGYIINHCYLMNYKMISFLPLGKDWGDVNSVPFAVTNWTNKDEIDCPKDTTSFVITMYAEGFTHEINGLTVSDISLFMNMTAYLRYDQSPSYYKYWYADKLKLSFSVGGEPYTYPITNGYIAAPQDKSYACQDPDIWPMEPPKDMAKNYAASLRFSELQFDVNFIFNGSDVVTRTGFSDGVDCDDRLGKGGIVGLAFLFLTFLIGLYLATMLSTAQNPVFGDKQIVVAQE